MAPIRLKNVGNEFFKLFFFFPIISTNTKILGVKSEIQLELTPIGKRCYIDSVWLFQ